MAFRHILSRSRLPVVIILGATGTGKTKLGVELAQRFETEIISADSMQIYKGLDVVTAKASVAERAQATHHLLDILEPHQVFTVVDFRNRALNIIDNLLEKGKIPVVVGGTNYYIESIVYQILVESMDDTNALLWETNVRKGDWKAVVSKKVKIERDQEKIIESIEAKADQAVDSSNVEASGSSEVKHREYEFTTVERLKEDVDNESQFSNEEIHSMLKAVDPDMAARLHPNNRRKVLRSIEVLLKSGRKHSEVLDAQKVSEGKLRRPGATIILWLKCDKAVHDERLNSRVDGMLQQGLIDELLNFHDRHNRQRIQDGKPADYTKGIFQTLGFKEFHEYLMMSEEERSSEAGQKLLQDSIDNMKMATRRFARKQNKMVRGRFLEHPTREVPHIYELDTTDLTKWTENVKEKAIHIIESFLEDKPCNFKPLEPVIDDAKREIDVRSSNYCTVCERLIIGDKEFKIHMNSNRHKRVLKKKKEQIKQNETLRK